MGDMCEVENVKLSNLELQSNGIIRNSRGRAIARLLDDIPSGSEHITCDIVKENKVKNTEPTYVVEKSAFNYLVFGIGYILFFVSWLAGFVVAKGVWATSFCIFPPYAWYLLLEKVMIFYGLV